MNLGLIGLIGTHQKNIQTFHNPKILIWSFVDDTTWQLYIIVGRSHVKGEIQKLNIEELFEICFIDF